MRGNVQASGPIVKDLPFKTKPAVSGDGIVKQGCGSGLQRFARFLLRLMGWQMDARLPEAPKFVLIVAPHTSNWDVFIGLVCVTAVGMTSKWRIGFLVKQSAAHWPVLGRMVRRFGAIPVDRGSPHRVVERMAAVFGRHDRLILGMAPEGTRKKVPYWKTGFYQIAVRAGVPIALGYLDYQRRIAGIGPVLTPCGDPEADLEIIRKFYAGIVCKHPGNAGEIRFKPGAGV